MINPFLQKRIFEFPVRPLLLEVEANQLTTIAGLFSAEGLSPRAVIPQFNMLAIPPVPSKAIERINALPGVRFVHADLESTILQILGGEDPEDWWPTSESRRLLGAEEANLAGFNGESARLGVIDTGVDPNHPQLTGADFDSTILFPREPGIDAGPQASGHGSHVASTAAGKQQLSPVQVFVEGVSRAPIISVQCLGRIIGTGFTSEIVNAIALAWDKGARVFNLSLGAAECQGTCSNCPECRIIRSLTQRGGMFFIAAGNSGPDPNTIACPGCVPEAITVAAIDRRGLVADFSSRGGRRFPGKPDIAAPGFNIYSGTGTGSQVDLGDPGASVSYAAISGTSMACPHAAGLGTILRQRDPAITTESFKARMRQQGAHNPNTGWGVPNWNMFTG